MKLQFNDKIFFLNTSFQKAILEQKLYNYGEHIIQLWGDIELPIKAEITNFDVIVLNAIIHFCYRDLMIKCDTSEIKIIDLIRFITFKDNKERIKKNEKDKVLKSLNFILNLQYKNKPLIPGVLSNSLRNQTLNINLNDFDFLIENKKNIRAYPKEWRSYFDFKQKTKNAEITLYLMQRVAEISLENNNKKNSTYNCISRETIYNYCFLVEITPQWKRKVNKNIDNIFNRMVEKNVIEKCEFQDNVFTIY